VQPRLEHWVQLWVPQYTKGTKLGERFQGRATKVVKGLEGGAKAGPLRSLGSFSLEKRRLRGDPISIYPFLKGSNGGEVLVSSLQ